MESSLFFLPVLCFAPMLCALVSYLIGRASKNARNAFVCVAVAAEFALAVYTLTRVLSGISGTFTLGAICGYGMTLEIDGFAGKEKLRLAVEHGVPSVTAFDGDCDFRLTHRQAMSALFGLMPAPRRALPAPVRSWLPLPLFVPEVDND